MVPHFAAPPSPPPRPSTGTVVRKALPIPPNLLAKALSRDAVELRQLRIEHDAPFADREDARLNPRQKRRKGGHHSIYEDHKKFHLKREKPSFDILYQELPPHKQRELLAFIIQSVIVRPTHIEMALFGRASLERFTLTGGVFAGRQNWLHESDAHQSFFLLLFEFPCKVIIGQKGKKYIVACLI